MGDFADARRKMVDCQLRTSDVTDHDIQSAMGSVPREAFVAAELAPLAYIDEELAIGGGRVLMRPATFGKLLQLAAIRPADTVLVVGGGSGYEAAVLARIAASVVAVESDSALAAAAAERLSRLGATTASVVTGSLAAGWPAGAPYDVILLTGAAETALDGLGAQLREGGRLVAVEGRGGAAAAQVYTRAGGGISGRFGFNAAARPLPGFEQAKAFVF